MNYVRSGLTLFSNVLAEHSDIILPTAIGSLMEMSLQDVRIGKIAGGVGLTISGVRLMEVSGISKTFKSLYRTNISGQNEESSSEIKLKWSTATLGFGAIICGVYSIATGVFELTTTYEQPLQNDADILYDDYFEKYY